MDSVVVFIGIGGVFGCVVCSSFLFVLCNRCYGGITVPRTAEPGTPISEVFGPFYTGNINGYQCNYVSQVYINLNTVLTPSSYSDVYETNVPGVGFKLFKSVGESVWGLPVALYYS